MYARSVIGNASSETGSTFKEFVKPVAKAACLFTRSGILGAFCVVVGCCQSRDTFPRTAYESPPLPPVLTFVHYSDRARDVLFRLKQFMADHIYPAEPVSNLYVIINRIVIFLPLCLRLSVCLSLSFSLSLSLSVGQECYRFISDPDTMWTIPPILEDLKEKAREAGLWNLFLPSVSGLGQLEYAPMAEEMGRCLFASEVFNCSAPDTGKTGGVISPWQQRKTTPPRRHTHRKHGSASSLW